MSANLVEVDVSRRTEGIRTLLLAAVVILTHALPAQSVTISGRVYDGPAARVTLSASGANVTTTTATGYYTLTVPQGWSGRVTPSASTWAFSPASRSYSNVTTNQGGQNFNATRSFAKPVAGYTISGFIRTAGGSGVAGVTVSRNDGGDSVTTDVDGYYQLALPVGWSGTVTPSKSGWTFNPPSRSYSELWLDEVSQDYTAMTRAWTISGHVRTSGGATISGVTVSADKGGGSATTDDSGSYSLVVPDAWSGVVTPSKPNYTFSPSSRNYSSVASNQSSQDYAATAPGWTLSGYVRTSDGSGITAVAVAANNGGGSATSDSAGHYSLTVLHGWSGEVAPSKTGYTFSPPSRSYSNVAANQGDQNYTGDSSVVIYVDAAAPGQNDGTSWANACRSLQDALGAASVGSEIRVAQGVYKPDRGRGETPGDRTASFRLVDGVTLKGGYAGVGKPKPEARDVKLYKTILSGDLKGDDTGDVSHPSRSENSYSVVTVEGVLETATLDGFTITGGNANGSASNGYTVGGGLATSFADLTLTRCTFNGNSAAGAGGGIVSKGGRLTLTHCSFLGNSGSRGGGLSSGYGGSPTSVTLTNCAFLGNLAATTGGGIEMVSGSSAITNCTFNGNTAANGGAVAGTGATITNCILWGNKPVAITGGASQVKYSDVQGGTGQPWFGAGCLDTNPLFADPDGRLSASSPCVDTGDNAAVPPDVKTDLAGNWRIQRAVVDMGAYEVVATPEDLLNRAIALVQGLTAASFTTSGSRNALVSELEAAVALLHAGLDRDALNSLREQVLPTMDGCGRTGQPDDTDWIATCEAQQKVYPLVLEAIEPLARRTLTVSAAPGGSVTKPGEGTFLYTDGQSVWIQAVAKAGYRFTQWSGTAVEAGKVGTPGSRNASVVVNANYTVIANFERVEDFEGGTLSEGWSTSSPAWYVSSYDSHLGQYSVRGGALGSAGGRTSLTLQAEVTAGQIKFWRRVLCQTGNGSYIFSIDGTPRDMFSGTEKWTEVSVPVTAGSHTFVWEYSRDAYAKYSSSGDTVYIDDLRLPPAP